MNPTVFVVCGLLIAQVAAADVVVFSTLGSGNTYDNFGAYYVGNSNSNFPVPLEWAAQFTAQASGLLSSIQLGLLGSGGGTIATTDADVFLYGNTNGLPDNSNQIFLGSVSPSGCFCLLTNSVVNLGVNGQVSVTLGSTYWLVLKPANPNGLAQWAYTAASPLGEMRYSSDNLTWNSQSNSHLAVFRIFAVPEPSAPVLLCIGLAAFCLVKASKRQKTSRLKAVRP